MLPLLYLRLPSRPRVARHSVAEKQRRTATEWRATLKTARAVAVQESRFWIVRPQAALTGFSGLDTVVGAKYVAILPGGGAPERRFVGLEEPPVLELEPPEPGGLRIVLESGRLGGLRP